MKQFVFVLSSLLCHLFFTRSVPTNPRQDFISPFSISNQRTSTFATFKKFNFFPPFQFRFPVPAQPTTHSNPSSWHITNAVAAPISLNVQSEADPTVTQSIIISTFNVPNVTESLPLSDTICTQCSSKPSVSLGLNDPLNFSRQNFIDSLSVCHYDPAAIDIGGLYNIISDSLLQTNGEPFFSARVELAMFLAQIYHESGGLHYTRECACVDDNCPLSYRYPQYDFSNTTYYYGRGFMQLSWSYNYRSASLELFNDERLVEYPDQVSEPPLNWLTALWYWKANVQWIPQVQRGMFGYSTRAINPMECEAMEKSDPMYPVFHDKSFAKKMKDLVATKTLQNIKFRKSARSVFYNMTDLEVLIQNNSANRLLNVPNLKDEGINYSNITVNETNLAPRSPYVNRLRENAVHRYRCYENIIKVWGMQEIVTPDPYGCYPLSTKTICLSTSTKRTATSVVDVKFIVETTTTNGNFSSSVTFLIEATNTYQSDRETSTNFSVQPLSTLSKNTNLIRVNPFTFNIPGN